MGSNKHIYEIDGIRAIAVISVMIFHLNSAWLPGGFTGVDIFFVISGYVVSRSLASSQYSGFWGFLVSFYARRVKRLLPALLVCLLVFTFLNVLFVPESWLGSATEKTALWAYFGAGNIALMLFNDGYFSPLTDYNAFVHTWSLGVEEQFYLLFPFLLLIALRFFRKSNGLWLFLLFALMSFVFSIYAGEKYNNITYYLLPSRFWELAAGVLLQRWHDRSPPKNERSTWVLISAGLILIVAGFVFSDRANFPYPWAIVPVVGTLLLLHGVSSPSPKNDRLRKVVLLNSFFVYTGKISYSLYLWHWPIYVLMRWTVGLDSLALKAVAVFLTFCLGVTSYRLVETPFNRLSVRRLSNGLVVVFFGVAFSFLSYLASSAMFENRNKITLSVTGDKSSWYAYPRLMGESLGEVDAYKGKKIFLIGDSHALAYRSIFMSVAKTLDAELELLYIGDCRIVKLSAANKPECEETVARVLKTVENKSKPGDIVFFAYLRLPRFGDQWIYLGEQQSYDYIYSERAGLNRQAALKESQNVIEDLRRLGLIVFMDYPKPLFPVPPFRCSDFFNKINPICAHGLTSDREMLLDLRRPVVNNMLKLEQEFDNVILVDPFPILCPETNARCSPYDENGLPLFFDGDHLSGHGNEVLYPFFLKKIQAAWDERNRMREVNVSDQDYLNLLSDGVHFGERALPSIVKSISGFSSYEPWGRWTDALVDRSAKIVFKKNLPENFILHVSGRGFAAKGSVQKMDVVIGGQHYLIEAPREGGFDQKLHIHLGSKQVDSMELIPHNPMSPAELGESDDKRKLGVGLVRLSIEAVPND